MDKLVDKLTDNNFPNISVVVPVLNAERDINRCIKSLTNQNYPKDRYEIIIVDNGSVDNTMTILNRYYRYYNNIKIIYEPNKGSYSARNTGTKNSKGEIIAFTDSDCIVSENWIRELSKGFISDNIGCVVGAVHSYQDNVQQSDTLVERFSKNKDIMSQKRTLNSNFLPYGETANVAFRKSVFGRIGYFDEIFKSGGDADIAWRMQLLTTYKLIYRQESIVEHHHRVTLKDLFLQHFKYGLGLAMLNKKYKRDKRNIGRMANYLKLAFNVCTQYLGYSKNKSSFKKNSDDINLIFDPLLSLICIAGYRSGMLYGMIKFRSLYINLIDADNKLKEGDYDKKGESGYCNACGTRE